MCEDQGMAIVSWASLGGGNLASAEQRKKAAEDPNAPKDYYPFTEDDLAVCNAIEEIASNRGTAFQAIVRCTVSGSDPTPVWTRLTHLHWQALAYLFRQSTYVFPIVGVQTPEHVRAMPDALRVSLTDEEVAKIQDAAPFNPLFPNNFLFPYKDGKGYGTRLRTSDVVQWNMAAWIDVPLRPQVRLSV